MSFVKFRPDSEYSHDQKGKCSHTFVHLLTVNFRSGTTRTFLSVEPLIKVDSLRMKKEIKRVRQSPGQIPSLDTKLYKKSKIFYQG